MALPQDTTTVTGSSTPALTSQNYPAGTIGGTNINDYLSLGGNKILDPMIQSLQDVLTGTPSSAQTSSRSLLTPEQEAMLQALLKQLNPAGNPVPVAPQNSAQTASLAALEQASMNQVTPGGQNDISSKALTDIMNAGPSDVNASVVNPTMQDFIQKVLPAISGRFSGMSGFGSDRMLQEALATGNATTSIAKARADALDTMQGRKIQAALGLPQVQGGFLQNILNTQAGGNAAQTAIAAEFDRQQKAKQANLDTILQALGIKGKENITTVLPGTPGLLSGGGGGAIGGAIGKIAGML